MKRFIALLTTCAILATSMCIPGMAAEVKGNENSQDTGITVPADTNENSAPEQGTDENSSEESSKPEQGTDENSSEESSKPEQGTDENSSEESSKPEQGTDENSSEESSKPEQGTDENSSEESSKPEQGTDENSSEESSKPEQGTDENSSEESSKPEQGTDEKPVDPKPADPENKDDIVIGTNDYEKMENTELIDALGKMDKAQADAVINGLTPARRANFYAFRADIMSDDEIIAFLNDSESAKSTEFINSISADRKTKLVNHMNTMPAAELSALLKKLEPAMAKEIYNGLSAEAQTALKKNEVADKPADEVFTTLMNSKDASAELMLLSADQYAELVSYVNETASVEDLYTLMTKLQDNSFAKLMNGVNATKKADLSAYLETLTAEQIYAFLKNADKTNAEALYASLNEENKTAVNNLYTAEQYAALYEKLLAAKDDKEVNALIKEFGGQVKYEAFLKSLTEEQYKALQAHFDEIMPVEVYVPHTVVFTHAGPFMPAVDVSEWLANTPMILPYLAAETDPNDPDGNGLALNKTVTPNTDGSYTITLESWTTGKVTSTETTTPADICIVVDQSKSMLDSLGSTQKSVALENSLNNFIDNVHKKYNAEKADHRISIVGYGENQNHDKEYIDTGWHEVDESGVNALKHGANGKIGIDDMEYKWQNTDVKAGMKKAETLMGVGYKYTGPNKERQKVVILFTDGYPSTTEETPGVPDDYGFDIANAALISSDNLKDAGVTVYSVGMFNGANPNETYGEKNMMDGTECYNKPDTSGYGKNEVWAYTDKMASYNPAANRFLNYVSSNYDGSEDARDIRIGDASQDVWSISKNKNVHYYGFRVTGKPYTPIAEQNYYLTAKDEASLDDVFQTIVEHVAKPTISLGNNVIMRDTVTQYFDMPKNAKKIDVYTQAYNGNGKWANRVKDTSLTPVMNGKTKTVEVKGFNYDDNFITENPHDGAGGNNYGKKLIVEFTVTPNEEFLGGNNVPTNTDNSGIIVDGKPMDKFEIPTVNVPIKDLTVTAPDAYVYLTHGTESAKSSLVNHVTVKFNEKPIAELEDWQKEFVTIENPVIEIANSDNVTNITDDMKYTAKVNVKPKKEASADSKGTANPIEGKTNNSAKQNILVLKPTITWKDSKVNAGEKANYDTQNFVKVEWKHGETLVESLPEGSLVIGNAPEIKYTYDPAAKQITAETPVKVTKVSIDGIDVDMDKHVKFKHLDCNTPGGCQFEGCKWDEYKKAGYHFVVHLDSFDLTIEKKITNDKLYDANDIFVFNISGNGVDMNVVIHGAGSVVVKNLPSGTYTVKELTDWSWRYTCDATEKQASATKNKVTFTNTLANEHWLTATDSVDNRWKSNTITPVTK